MQQVHAQRFPVSGSLQFYPPFSSSLLHYANPAAGQDMRLNITLNDFSLGNLSVKLRVSIRQGTQVIAQSIEDIAGERAIRLEGGYTQSFTIQDLALYFQLENLQGISEEMYSRTLPEGVYEISFLVLDAFTSRVLSDKIGWVFPVMLNAVPQLYTPGNRENVRAGAFSFQWSPSGTQQSYIQYRLILKELLGEENAIEQEFANTSPLVDVTVDEVQQSSVNLPVPLQEGHRYAWQVIAQAKPGFEGTAGGFKTNGSYGEGASNIHLFIYQGNCQGISSLQLEAAGSNRLLANWPADARYSTYHIQYRKAGEGEWIEEETGNNFFTISSLEASTMYEVKVGVACGGIEADNAILSFSDVQTAETLGEGEVAGVNCGQVPVIDLANEELITELKPGDEITAGDFKIVLTSVNGGSGGWSGVGWTKVPVFMDTKWKLEFENIQVNTLKQLVAGMVETGFDVDNNGILDVEEIAETLAEMWEDLTDQNFFELKKTIDEFLANNNLSLPDELKEKLEEVMNKLETALQEYARLKEAYDKMEDGPEKERALQVLNVAKEKADRLKGDLAAVLSERDAFVKNYSDLIKKVLRELRAGHTSILVVTKPEIARVFPVANNLNDNDEGIAVEPGELPFVNTDTRVNPAQQEFDKTVHDHNKSTVYNAVSFNWDQPDGLLELLTMLQEKKAPSALYAVKEEQQQVDKMKQLIYSCVIAVVEKRMEHNRDEEIRQSIMRIVQQEFNPQL